jgi:pantoate--beta-alanine ligase
MKVVESIEEVRRLVREAKAAGNAVGLVPTMGALHEGHMSLIDAAKKACGYVVVSIFVNPTQFGPKEDAGNYPRTTERDLAACERRGADLVFMPGVATMYPQGPTLATVSVAELAGNLCGRSRPGHFAGVCTVVAKFFNIVLPNEAFFGAKDYQQAAILRRMAVDLDFPIEVVICPTVREADGLAMSSRNAYLTAAERRSAPGLHEALCLARDLIGRSHPPASEVAAAIRGHIARRLPQGAVDYVQIVDPETLRDVEKTDRAVVIALAVKLGKARLIDNMMVD